MGNPGSATSERPRPLRGFLVLAFCLLAGCGAVEIKTDPGAFDVQPDKLAHLRSGEAVSLVNGYPGEAKLQLRPAGGAKWIVDQQQLTGTAITMLTRALEKQGIQVRERSERTITLRLRVAGAYINKVGFGYYVYVPTAQVVLQAAFGDGSATSARAQNGSPHNAGRAFDGAVLFALNDLLKDEKFVAYVNP